MFISKILTILFVVLLCTPALILAGDYPEGKPFIELQKQIDQLGTTDSAILKSMERYLKELRAVKGCLSSFIETGEVPEDCLSPVASERKNVFVTSTKYSANLGGLQGADKICQKHADNAGLSGTYKAWLSDSFESPDTRFNKQGGPYMLTNGVTIARNWDDLTDGSLLWSIQIDEYGNILAPEDQTSDDVWTGTNCDGRASCTPSPEAQCDSWGLFCYQWTQEAPDSYAMIGDYTGTDCFWSLKWGYPECNEMKHLYCFEQ